MRDNSSSFLGMDQQQQFPQLQKWLGISLANTVELGHIVESPIICTATSIVPLGWNGVPGEKNIEPIKVDITGVDLHLCTLVQARVNGNWYYSFPILFHILILYVYCYFIFPIM